MPENMFFVHLFIIMLIQQQQFLCHGNWATRTPVGTTPASQSTENLTTTTTTATPTTNAPPVLLVSASEATLLTMRFFNEPQTATRSDNHDKHKNSIENEIELDNEEENEEDVDVDETFINKEMFSPTKNATVQKNTVKRRYRVLSVHTHCTRDVFNIRLELNRPFQGLLYAKDFPLECRTRGISQTNITLRLPTSGCGVRAEPRDDGSMEYFVRVMLQTEQKLRQSSDILRTVRCQLPANAMGMTVTPLHEVFHLHNQRNGRMRTLSINQDVTKTNKRFLFNNTQKENSNLPTEYNSHEMELEKTATATTEQVLTDDSTTLKQDTITTTTILQSATKKIKSTTYNTGTPRVRIWLELGGPDGSGVVEVGQATTLTVRAIVPGTMGVRVVDCAAFDGLGESTQQLLDERGCPIDEQVMPGLRKVVKPAEEGWSKHNEDDLIEKIFSTTFPAFKFPDRERLHVSCGVQLWKGNCPNINCHSKEQLVLLDDQHLARIEVFNSLAVTAPQIEIDRLRYDRRYNTNGTDDHPHYVRMLPAEGTLCLSLSKLALSFCVLGLIFLVAVIVAICSVIRSRRNYMHRCGSGSGIGSGGIFTSGSSGGSRCQRADVCTSMFSSSSESAQSVRFGSKLFIPYYPQNLPYGRVY